MHAPKTRRACRTVLLLLEGCLPAALSAAFFAFVVLVVTRSTVHTGRIHRSWRAARLRFAVEEIVLRALAGGRLEREGRSRLEQGPLSPWPELPASVSRVAGTRGRRLLCRLATPAGPETWEVRYSRGLLPGCFAWALGQGDPAPSAAWEGGRVVVAGESGRFQSGGPWEFRHPLSFPGAFAVMEDCSASPGAGGRCPTVVADESLALRTLPEGTDLDDFRFAASGGQRPAVRFPPGGPRLIRIQGHLWLGADDRPLRVDPGGRDLVILVHGNLYVTGGVHVPPGRGRLWFLVGEPGRGGFRDRDRDGRRDPGEEAPLEGDLPGPREGCGLVYLGFGARSVPLDAGVLARHDAIAGPGGARVRGPLLLGGRLVVPADASGRVLVGGPSRRRPLPCRGLPLLPGTRRLVRLHEVVPLAAGGLGAL